MELWRLLLLGLAAAAAGAVNSIAGGGSLISFPAAVAAGLPPVVANATNSVALTPGGIGAAIAYRRELGSRRRLALWLALPAALGGLAGALALLAAPERVFRLVVPWLVLAASLLMIVQERLKQRATARARVKGGSRTLWVGAGVGLVAIYGGYFGAGIGIMTLALLALLGEADLHELNAMKSVIVASVNGTAALFFIVAGTVRWEVAVVMAAGASAGGYGGAALARRTDPAKVRWVVVGIGVTASVILALRLWT